MNPNHLHIVLPLAFACLSLGCSRGTDNAEPVSKQTEQKAATHEPDRVIAKTFGQRQLEQILQDRPDMREVIPESHPVFRWLVDSFDGDRIGQRIYWNERPPQSGRPFEHAPPDPERRYLSYIAVSAGPETTPIDKWAGLVYEMYNLENNNDFDAIWRLALEGQLDGDGFAEKTVELEFVALTRTQEFLRANPLPKSKHGGDVWYNWVTSDLGTFEDYQKSFDAQETNSFNSNFVYFKDYYDRAILPYLAARRRTNQ